MEALVLHSEGAPRLVVAALDLGEAHHVIASGGYPALLELAVLDAAPLGLIVTSWALCLRQDPFRGVLGSSPTLFADLGLPRPAFAPDRLLLQAVKWLGVVRSQPARLRAGGGPVARARLAFAMTVAQWPEMSLARLPPRSLLPPPPPPKPLLPTPPPAFVESDVCGDLPAPPPDDTLYGFAITDPPTDPPASGPPTTHR